MKIFSEPGLNPAVRNEKSTSLGERGRAAGSFFCATVLAALTAGFLLSGSALFAWVAVLPAVLAVLLVISGIHSLFAARTPPTTIVLGEEPLRRGVSIGVQIRQAGPVCFESLRANLICECIERTPSGKSRNFSYPYQINILDAGSSTVPGLHIEEFRAAVTVPAEAEPSLETVQRRICWRIEIWGKVAGSADFMRPFDVEVV